MTQRDNVIALIACSKKKLQTDKPVPAFDLYQGQLFKSQLFYAAGVLGLPPTRIFVLSAKYGIVRSGALLVPYDQTLSRMPARDRRRWGMMVAYQLGILTGTLVPGGVLVEEVFVLGGGLYREPVYDALRAYPTAVTTPHPDGLGYAQQVAWYKEQRSSHFQKLIADFKSWSEAVA